MENKLRHIKTTSYWKATLTYSSWIETPESQGKTCLILDLILNTYLSNLVVAYPVTMKKYCLKNQIFLSNTPRFIYYNSARLIWWRWYSRTNYSQEESNNERKHLTLLSCDQWPKIAPCRTAHNTSVSGICESNMPIIVIKVLDKDLDAVKIPIMDGWHLNCSF